MRQGNAIGGKWTKKQSKEPERERETLPQWLGVPKED